MASVGAFCASCILCTLASRAIIRLLHVRIPVRKLLLLLLSGCMRSGSCLLLCSRSQRLKAARAALALATAA
jgi:hypothetical protein